MNDATAPALDPCPVCSRERRQAHRLTCGDPDCHEQHQRRLKPVVGMGATMQIGSDSYAYTITAVSPSGHRITMQRDRTVPTKASKPIGYVASGPHMYTADPEGTIEIATRRQDGRYRLKGAAYYGAVTLGIRHHSLDPHF